MTSTTPLRLRPATAADDAAVALLAQLDETTPLAAPVLVAYAGDRPLAAVSVTDGRTAADPFAPTRDAVALLRLQVAQARGSGTRRGLFGLGRRSAGLALG